MRTCSYAFIFAEGYGASTSTWLRMSLFACIHPRRGVLRIGESDCGQDGVASTYFPDGQHLINRMLFSLENLAQDVGRCRMDGKGFRECLQRSHDRLE